MTKLFLAVFCGLFMGVGVNGVFASSESAITIPEADLTIDQNTDQPTAASHPIQHIGRKEIIKNSAVNLPQLLQEQSTVRLYNAAGDDPSQTSLSIRGFGDNAEENSLILIDGFPQINTSDLPPDLGLIDTANIASVDIFQGSAGTLWGNQAVGGVVNITTLHPEKLMRDLTLGMGDPQHEVANALLADKFKNGIFFKINGLYNNNDHYRLHNNQQTQSGNAEVGVDYDHGTVWFATRQANDSIELAGPLTEFQYNTDPRQTTTPDNSIKDNTALYQLFNKQILSDDWILENRLSYDETNVSGYVYAPFSANERDTRFSPQITGQSFYHSTLTMGSSIEDDDYSKINVGGPVDIQTQQFDLFGQGVLPIKKKFALTMGARAAEQNNFQVLVTEQGLTFNPTSNWQLFVRRDGNFRFAKADENLWLPTNVSALQPQTGVSYEAGTRWTTLKQKFELNIYRLDLQNEIAYDPTQSATQPFGAYRNLDNTRRDGVTARDSYHVTDKLAVNGQLNFVNARFIAGPFSGNEIPAVPAWTADAGMNYQLTEHWKAGYNGLYNGSQYASNDDGNINGTVKGYWLHQIFLQYFLKKLSVNFTISNLLNQRYAIYTYYDSDAQANYFYPGEGRSYLLVAKVNL